MKLGIRFSLCLFLAMVVALLACGPFLHHQFERELAQSPARTQAELIVALTQVALSTLLVALFVVWVAAELVLKFTVLVPLCRLLRGLKLVATYGVVSPHFVRAVLATHAHRELRDLAALLMEILNASRTVKKEWHGSKT